MPQGMTTLAVMSLAEKMKNARLVAAITGDTGQLETALDQMSLREARLRRRLCEEALKQRTPISDGQLIKAIEEAWEV